MSVESVLARLEAVASKLEAFAASNPSAKKSAGGAADEKELAPSVTAFADYYNEAVAPFVEAAKASTETAYIGEWTETAFKHTQVTLQAATECKKPSDKALMDFVGPIAKVIGQADGKADSRSPYFPQQKAFAEGIQCLSFLMVPGTKQHVNACLESADFYLIKALKAGKDKGGDEGQKYIKFAQTFKTMLNKLGEYCHEYHKTGVTWNAKGGDISTFSASAPANAGAGAPPPPPGPAPTAADLSKDVPAAAPSKPAPSMTDVFAALSGGVTSGLRTVTADMKSKNMKDKPALQPKSAPKPAAATPAKKEESKKPPKTELTKGTWFVENYDGETITLDEVQVKEGIYLVKCRNSRVIVNGKCKSIQVDSCFKTTIVFKSVVSTFELFNSQKCHAVCTEIVPAVAFDKSQGCSITISRANLANPPQIITSNISEMNLVIPGATDEDDPIEIPLPEQYLTVLKDGKLETNPVTHGD